MKENAEKFIANTQEYLETLTPEAESAVEAYTAMREQEIADAVLLSEELAKGGVQSAPENPTRTS